MALTVQRGVNDAVSVISSFKRHDPGATALVPARKVDHVHPAVGEKVHSLQLVPQQTKRIIWIAGSAYYNGGSNAWFLQVELCFFRANKLLCEIPLTFYSDFYDGKYAGQVEPTRGPLLRFRNVSGEADLGLGGIPALQYATTVGGANGAAICPAFEVDIMADAVDYVVVDRYLPASSIFILTGLRVMSSYPNS
jgi:hypothetical protein